MGNIIKKIQAGTITYDIEPANAAELDVTNKAPTLAWNTTSTIATVNGTDITVKMPANPDTKVTVDTALSSTSTNPVQNKVINSALAGKAGTAVATTDAAGLMSAADKTKLDGIAAGAEVNVQSDWNATSGDAFIKNKPTILTIGTGATNAAAGNHTHDYQPKDADLTAIAGLTGTSGLLKKTAANSWTLDTNSYLTSHQTIVQDGVVGASVYNYAVCETAAGTAAKTANILLGQPKNLPTGLRVIVKFTAKNTANNPTFNLNGFGAKKIFHNGAQITSGTNKGLLYGACEFIYDGTQWLLVGNYVDTNTTYSSKDAASGGTTVSLVTTGEKYTWNHKASTAAATTTTAGLMSAADKVKLNGIAAGANKVTKAKATGNTTTVASNSHIHSVTASGSVSLSHTSTNSGKSGTGNTGAPSGTTATVTVITGSYTNGVLTLSTTTVASNSHVHAGPSHSHTYDKSTSASFSGTAVNSGTPGGTTATTTVPTSGHTHGLE